MYWLYSRKHSIYGNQRNTHDFLSSIDSTNPSINNLSEPQQSEPVSLVLNSVEMPLTSPIRSAVQRKQYDFTSLATNTNRTRVILLWYNPNMDSSLECEDTKLMLSNITENVRIYRLEAEFLNYLNIAKKEESSTDTSAHLHRRIFILVLAGHVAEQLLIHTEDFHSVQAVYILSEDRSSYEPLKNRFRKLKGIYTKRAYLKRPLSRDLQHYAVYNFYHDNTTQTSTWDLTTRKTDFLWFQQVQKLLLNEVSSGSPEAKRDFISICHDYCDKHYKNDRHYLRYLEHDYKAKDAIKEYTKANFLHELVNRALRTEDIEEVYRFRWYLAQLCSNLEQETECYRSRQQQIGVSVIKLYRGQLCSPDELKRICDGSGFIATNGFLSTTYDRSVAIAFAESAKGAPGGDTALLLLEITVNLNQTSSTILAETSHFGNFKQEEEVLFGLGAHFEKEGKCVQDEEGRWILKMQATYLGQEIASHYVSCRLTEMANFSSPSSLHSTFLKMILSQMLIEMGQYKKAIKFLDLILPTTDEERAIRYFGLADAKLSCIDDQERVTIVDEAVALLTEAVDLFVSLKNLLRTANTLRRLADALVLKEEYTLAKNHYQQAHRIYRGIDRQEANIASCINGLADVYLAEKSYDQAEILYKDALNKRRLCLSDEDPAIARSYYSLGRYYYFKRNNEENARMMIKESLWRKMRIYPLNHPSVLWNSRFLKILLPEKKQRLFNNAAFYKEVKK